MTNEDKGLHIVIDAVGTKHSGGATVLLDLLSAAESVPEIRSITVLASPKKLRRFEFPISSKVSVLDVPSAEGSAGRIAWALRGLDAFVAQIDADIALGLNGLGPVHSTKPSVVFLQQALPYSFEALSRCSIGMRLRMRLIRWLAGRSAKAASIVIVQSKCMHELVSRELGLVPGSISIHMPTAPHFAEVERDSLRTADHHQPSILYVGNDESYKNLEVVAKGLSLLGKDVRPEWVVTLPPSSWVCRNGAATSLGILDHEGLKIAYKSACMLVMPSLTESLGLPMLEAMRLGTPVLAADRPYARAACEDAALYFDPLSAEDFSRKLEQMLHDSLLRESMAQRGRAIICERDSSDPYRKMLMHVSQVAIAALRVQP